MVGLEVEHLEPIAYVSPVLSPSFHEFGRFRVVYKVEKVVISRKVFVRDVGCIPHVRPHSEWGGVDD